MEGVLEQLRPQRIAAEIQPIWQERIEQMGNDALSVIGFSGSFNMLNPLVLGHIEDMALTRMAMVTESTKAMIRSELREGFRRGEGIDKISRRLRESAALSGARAKRIARTEVNRSANWATTEAHRQSGIVTLREWVATPDDRLRDTHAQLDGARTPLDKPFDNGFGLSAMHPGDFGDPSEDINCRCTTVAVVKSLESMADEERRAYVAHRWKQFDHQLTEWETLAEPAVARGLAAHIEQVIEGIRPFV